MFNNISVGLEQGGEERPLKPLHNANDGVCHEGERSTYVFLYMCVALVVSHIMTDSRRVTCSNDLHAYTALYGFLNLFSCAECALMWNTTWRSCSSHRAPGRLTVSETDPFPDWDPFKTIDPNLGNFNCDRGFT